MGASKKVFTGGSTITVKFNGDINQDSSVSSTKIKPITLNICNLKSKYKTSEKVHMKLNKKASLKLKVTVTIKKKRYSLFFKTKNGKANIKLYSKFNKYGLKKGTSYTFEFKSYNNNYLINKKNSSKKISFK